MKKSIFLLLGASVLLLIALGSCKKSKTTNPGTLTIQTTPASGSNQAAAPGPDFPLVVSITSSMPSGGVRIEISAHAEGSTMNFYTNSVNTSNATNNFLITGSPQGVTSVVDVTVTDLSNTSNKASSSYRFARK